MYNSINDWIKCNGKQRRLTHRGLVTHIRVSKLCHHWFSQWLGAFSAPSHYLNQCWLIINCTLRNKCEWSLKRNKDIFSQANVIETTVVNMAATLFRSQYVKQCHEMVIISFTLWMCWATSFSACYFPPIIYQIRSGTCLWMKAS